MKRQPSTQKLISYSIVCGLGILIIIAFRPNFMTLYEMKTHYYHLKQKLILEEKRNYFLKKEFNGLSNDPSYIEKVAREKLGWCRPTETVYRFQTHPSDPDIIGTSGGPSDSNN